MLSEYRSCVPYIDRLVLKSPIRHCQQEFRRAYVIPKVVCLRLERLASSFPESLWRSFLLVLPPKHFLFNMSTLCSQVNIQRSMSASIEDSCTMQPRMSVRCSSPTVRSWWRMHLNCFHMISPEMRCHPHSIFDLETVREPDATLLRIGRI